MQHELIASLVRSFCSIFAGCMNVANAPMRAAPTEQRYFELWLIDFDHCQKIPSSVMAVRSVHDTTACLLRADNDDGLSEHVHIQAAVSERPNSSREVFQSTDHGALYLSRVREPSEMRPPPMTQLDPSP